MIDEQQLDRALEKATSPLVQSVRDFAEKLTEHRIEMAGSISEIRTDVRYLKETQEKQWTEIGAVKDKTTKTVTEKHSLAPKDGELRIPLTAKVFRTLVVVVGAALVGAALVGALLLGEKVASPSIPKPSSTQQTKE